MQRLANNRRALSLGMIGGLAVLLLSIGVALAAGEMIPRASVGSGGGQISGDGLVLRSAIGQPVAGAISNGITLCTGYLCGPIGDTASPTVEGTSPTDGATDVPRNAPIVVDFSEGMNTESVSYLITPTVALTSTWSNGDSRLTLAHAELAASTRYTTTVSSGSDLAGNPLSNAPYTWVFTTSIVSASEADLALGKGRIGTGDVTAGGRITYSFTITNSGPTTPVTATLVDVFSSAEALADVSGSGCAWTAGSTDVTCIVTDVITDSTTQLTLTVTTEETYSGPLTNNASITPNGDIVDPNPGNDDSDMTVIVTEKSSGSHTYFIYLPAVLR